MVVTLSSSATGLDVERREEGAPGKADGDTGCYADYDDLSRDELGRLALSLLERTTYGKVPDLTALAVLALGRPAPADPAAIDECRQCIAALDDESYAARAAASRRLASPRLAAQLPQAILGLRLSTEQHCRVMAVLTAYELPEWAALRLSSLPPVKELPTPRNIQATAEADLGVSVPGQ